MPPVIRHPGALFGGLGGVAALFPAPARACAVCVGWGSEGQGLNGGFYWSALLLTALPFAVVAVIGIWVFHTVRHGGARSAAPTPTLPPSRSSSSI